MYLISLPPWELAALVLISHNEQFEIKHLKWKNTDKKSKIEVIIINTK